MRNLTLHSLLEAFTMDAGSRLSLATAGGDEIPFEVVQNDGGRRGGIPLYCYRPMTSEFIRARLGLLSALPSYAPAAQALEGVGGLDLYLRARGEIPDAEQGRELADLALRGFLARVFAERSEFAFDAIRFERAYQELERIVYEGRCVTEMIAELLGVDLDSGTQELALGDGLSLMRPAALTAAPAALLTATQPRLLLVLRVAHDRAQRPSTGFARARFRRVLTALRLFERGSYALGALGYSRLDDGAWKPLGIGVSVHPRRLTLIGREHEDELRGFCNLIARHLPSGAQAGEPDNSGAGELRWALARYEMGCERATPYEALTDYLLALRALLEPEGPASGRLAQRLSAICAGPEDRAALAERTAHAIALERAVITGLAPAPEAVQTLADELAEHLRAILRDVLCGHLGPGLCDVADELIAAAAQSSAAAAV